MKSNLIHSFFKTAFYVALVGISSTAISWAAPAKIMKVSIGVPESHFEYQAMNQFKAYVEEKTKGEIIVQIYGSNLLGNDQEALEAIKLNSVQMNLPAPSVMGNMVKEFNLLELPFIFPDEATANRVVDGAWGTALLGKLDKAGFVGLGFGNFGFRHVTNSIRPITQLDDFKGLKLRTLQSRAHLDAFRALGSNPTPMPFSELFSALQLGTVDGQENPYTNIYSQRIYEVQKHISDSGHVYSWVVFVVGKKFFNGLTPEQQNIMREATQVAVDQMRKAVTTQDQESLKAMIDKGLIFTPIPSETKAAMRKAVQAVVEEHANKISTEMYQALQQEIAQ